MAWRRSKNRNRGGILRNRMPMIGGGMAALAGTAAYALRRRRNRPVAE